MEEKGEMESLIELLPGAIVGALVAEFIAVAIKLVRFTPTLLDKDTHKAILGCWEFYACVRDAGGEFTIQSAPIKISIDPFRHYRVSTNDGHGNRYRGSATREGGNIVILIRSKDRKYPDMTCHKISLIPIDDYKTFVGTFVSTDYRQRVCGGISALARNKTSDAEMRKLIEKNFVFSSNRDAMSVK